MSELDQLISIKLKLLKENPSKKNTLEVIKLTVQRLKRVLKKMDQNNKYRKSKKVK